jgi:TatD DNase family protein
MIQIKKAKGLDYDRLEFCEKEVQQKYFNLQFELSKETKLPLFLHNRNTKGDFASILKQNKNNFTTGVVHSFDGTTNELKELLEFDNLFIGINGCSLKTEENLKTMALIPKERLMIETDSPYCGIRPTHASHSLMSTKLIQEKDPKKFEKGLCVKGRNEPYSIINVLEVISKYRKESFEDLQNQIYENTKKVFFPNE